MTKKVTITETTWKQKIVDNYVFKLQVIEDGVIVYTRIFTNALEAVTMFNTFIDYGTCKYSREVVLLEPSGEMHGKVFDRPLAVH